MARGTLRIEKMRPEDLDEVLRIEVASFSQPWTREMFEAELMLASALALVARSEEQGLLGYICGAIVEGTLHIGNIAVDPRVRRHGVGKRLLLSALAQASRKGAEEASLEVRASNLSAQALYRNVGFHVVGRRRRYYTAPVEDALIMSLEHLAQAVTVRSEGERA